MNVIKKIVMVFVILIAAAIVPATIACARAGGGGGGGGGGAGGTAGGTGIHSGYATNESPISTVIGYVIVGVAASGGAIFFFVRVHLMSAKAKKAMKHISKMDESWNYKDFREHINKMFYTIQNAWMERNQEIAKNYLSASLYEQYQAKSEWMIIRHEKNILKNIRIIEAIPIAVEDNEGEANDRIWVYVKARMVDYTIDDQTMEIQKGSTISSSFIEYWKLIKENGNWVLDEIRQKDEFNLNQV